MKYTRHTEKDKRTCSRCKVKKDINDFYSLTHYECKPCYCLRTNRHAKENIATRRIVRQRWQMRNRKKSVGYSTVWRQNNYPKVMNAHLMRCYNISFDAYIVLLQSQNNACAICKVLVDRTIIGKRPCVDHNHTNNMIRGILCAECNSGLGFFKDNTDMLRTAIEYLERHK